MAFALRDHEAIACNLFWEKWLMGLGREIPSVLFLDLVNHTNTIPRKQTAHAQSKTSSV